MSQVSLNNFVAYIILCTAWEEGKCKKKLKIIVKDYA